MFQITENAGKLIRKMTQKNGFTGGGLRIGIKAGGCSGLSYVFAWEPEPKPGDVVCDGPDGARVFVDKKSYKFIDGTTLDYDTSLVSKGFLFDRRLLCTCGPCGFLFDNPNAKGTCGCGTSFSV